MEPIYFRGPAELRDWLDANHQTADEVYVGAWKKGTGRPSLTWEEIVDEALCFGWIDGVRRPVDGDRWAIRLTPRRKGSNWSDRNIGRVEALRAEGRMRPAGEDAFAARREDRSGVYSFEQRRELVLAQDEEARFRAEPAAWAWFSAQAPSYRRTAIFWVVSAKRPETRERRLATLIEDSAAGRDVKPIARNRRPGGG
ncbi:MAG TPA: YdeI/OmpD-associated family protein [Candidatus Limnocylindrales bacterium]|nr:YdeI/OmpD-associated family protein [Candidatus Limnocylindrales bacterium]